MFETFPWPFPTDEAAREAVASAMTLLMARRSEVCSEGDIGLTTVYNRIDEGAYSDLKAMHLELDVAVVKAYGWPTSVGQDDDELVRRLLKLNREITSGDHHQPFGDRDPGHQLSL